MGKDISLIMTSGKSLVDIIKAGQQEDPVKTILELVGVPEDESYDRLPEYLKDILDKNSLRDTNNLNTRAGFIASWILSSVKPAWYFRNCSISLLLEQEGVPKEKWSRYISDWAVVSNESLPSLTIENHFADANYSLGCLISPENCKNFLDDYGSDSNFKAAVDRHFGIFVASLIDALYSALNANTDLIESMDIFVVSTMNPETNRWQFDDQYSYSTDTYNELGIALQAFTIEAQIYAANAQGQQAEGSSEMANAYLDARQNKINMMIHNGNAYSSAVSAKTGLDLPELTPAMW